MKIELQNYFTKRLQYIHYTGHQTTSRTVGCAVEAAKVQTYKV